jgi:ferredoxin-type protein NapF
LTPFRTRLAAGILLGLVVWFWPLAWRFAAPALSPFLAISSAPAVRTVSPGWLLAIPMLLLVIARRRFWCRHLCPVGLISESCGKLRGGRAAAVKPAAPAPAWPPARYLALATMGGAIAGYPLFIWMDPLALFSGFFNIARITRPGVPVFSAAGLPLVMLISVLLPGLWCSRICPLGGTQDLLALAAGWLRRNDRGPCRREVSAGRRAAIALGVGSLMGVLVPKSWALGRQRLRPPGAVNEETFQSGCIRCGSCSRACPAGIIQPATARSDAAGILTPQLRFDGPNYCLQDCNLCGRVCPTGVIRPLALEEKNRHVIGIAAVHHAACLLALEKECGVCVPRCPRRAIVDIFNRETYQSEIRVLSQKCNGCGACVGICPPRVIRIEPLGRTSAPAD